MRRVLFIAILPLLLTNRAEARILTPDPELVGAWWIERLGIRKAWQFGTGKGVVLAVCDSGFFTGAADLAANLDFSRRQDFADDDEPGQVDDGPYAFHGTAT